MAVVLGINAVFHDPAAALVVDGRIVAAAEEERFSRRKHGKSPVPFSTWELPERAIAFCLEHAGIRAGDIDRVGYSYDPRLARCGADDLLSEDWEGLRTLYAERADRFLHTLLPELRADAVEHVPHHVAHAASAYLGSPFDSCSVIVCDGRGERGSYLAGHADGGELTVLATQDLPHSLGLRYEEVTEHLGFRRSSDEYKVMALASYARPTFIDAFRDAIRSTGDGGFCTEMLDLDALAPRRKADDPLDPEHFALAASMQARLEEVLLELACWLHDRTGDDALALAGGVALN